MFEVTVGGLTNAIESGTMLIDFDARSGHNHGTKFRIQYKALPLLYQNRVQII